MLDVSVRLPDVYIDAKLMVEEALKQGNKVSLKTYRGLFSNLCDVTHFHTQEIEDKEGYSNLDIVLTYKKRMFSPDNQFRTVEETKNLRVLSAQGDNQWTHRMINKVWEGDYPSTVSVDMESGEIFFFSIKLNRIELIKVGVFTPEQFEIFRLECHDREPYSIKIAEEAMFNFIDEAEGVRHLQDNIIVRFNCGLPIDVRVQHEQVII